MASPAWSPLPVGQLTRVAEAKATPLGTLFAVGKQGPPGARCGRALSDLFGATCLLIWIMHGRRKVVCSSIVFASAGTIVGAK